MIAICSVMIFQKYLDCTGFNNAFEAANYKPNIDSEGVDTENLE